MPVAHSPCVPVDLLPAFDLFHSSGYQAQHLWHFCPDFHLHNMRRKLRHYQARPPPLPALHLLNLVPHQDDVRDDSHYHQESGVLLITVYESTDSSIALKLTCMNSTKTHIDRELEGFMTPQSDTHCKSHNNGGNMMPKLDKINC